MFTAVEQLLDAGELEQLHSGELRRSGLQRLQGQPTGDLGELLANLASELLSIAPEDVDIGVNLALERVSRFVGADRAYIFDYDLEREKAIHKYEWCNEGIEPQKDVFPEIEFKDFSRWIEQHSRGSSVIVDNVSELEEGEIRDVLMSQSIKSTANVPMMGIGGCTGCIGFDQVYQARVFSTEELRLLQVLAQLLTNVRKLNQDRIDIEVERNKLEIIVEGTAAGTWIYWFEDDRLEINAIWASMLGYTLSELSPATIKTWEDLSHPEDLKVAKELLESNLENETPYYEATVRMRHKDGHWRYILTRGRMMIRNEMGIGLVAAGIHQDITEREMSRRALQEISDIVVHSPIVAIRWQNTHGWPVSYCSDNIRNFGYKPEQLLDGKIVYSELIHPEDLPRIEAHVAEHIAKGPDEYRQEYRLKHAHNGWIWVEDHTWLNRDSSGNVIRINGVLFEITERKNALDALQKSEATLLSAQRISKIVNWTLDLSTGDIEGQGEINDMLGISSSQFLSNSEKYLEIVHQDDRERIYSVIKNVFSETLPSEAIEHRIKIQTGDVRWVRLSSEFIYNDYGDPIGILGTLQDITHTKQLEFDSAALAIVLNSSTDIAVLKSLDGRFLAVSDTFCKVIELKREQIIGKTDAELSNLNKDNVALIGSFADKISELSTGKSVQFERTITLHNDLKCDFFFRGFPIYRQDERYIYGVALLGVDISEKNRISLRLAESEARLRVLFDEAPASIIIYDVGKCIVIDANKTALQRYNLASVTDLNQGNGHLNRMIYDDSILSAELLEKIASEDGTYTFETCIVLPDGASIWERVTLTPVLIDGVARVMAHGIDITQRIIAEKALIDREALYSALFETLPIGVSLTDLETGRFEDVNQAFVETSGHTKFDLLTDSYDGQFANVFPDRYLSALIGVCKNGSYGPHEEDFPHKSGKVFPARL
ncbi:MAG: PAS domain S-box protein, partial [Anaerolineales bacterium]